MTRELLAIALALAFTLPVAADPEKADSARVSGGASKSVGEKPTDEGACPGEDEDPEDCPGFDDDDSDEMLALPMLWNFSSPKMATIDAVKKLFKAYPGEVTFGPVKKVKGEYEMEIRTLAKTVKDEDAFSETMEKKFPDTDDDMCWTCEPDEKRMKELEAAKAKQEEQRKKDAKKGADPEKGKCPEPKK